MKLDNFVDILNKYVVYLYPNLKILDKVKADFNQYAKLIDNSMFVKGDKLDDDALIISSAQTFTPNDELLLDSFIDEISFILSYPTLSMEYVDTLIQSALNNAIAKTLSSISYQTITMVIDSLTTYSERTYEGRKISYGVIINDRIRVVNRSNNLHFENFINDTYSAVLTNGTESFIEIDSDGYVNRYRQLNFEKQEDGYAPFNYTRSIQYCGSDCTGVVLTSKGEILIMHNGELRFTKRGGRWNSYSHKENIQKIYDRSENDTRILAKSVYLTALDISFNANGGIIAFIDENKIKQALNHVNIKDIVNEKYYEIKKELMNESNDPDYNEIEDINFNEFMSLKQNGKISIINKLIAGRKFHLLYRKLREELVGIDGATLIDYNGEIVAIGAIIKIEAGSRGGGRIAAAKTLSQYGVSMEISSDASIKGFALNDEGHSEQIFVIADYQRH